MNDREDILATRLDCEPNIFRGCSSTELATIAGLSVLFWLPISLTIAGLFDAISMGIGITAIGVLLTVIVSTLR